MKQGNNTALRNFWFLKIYRHFVPYSEGPRDNQIKHLSHLASQGRSSAESSAPCIAQNVGILPPLTANRSIMRRPLWQRRSRLQGTPNIQLPTRAFSRNCFETVARADMHDRGRHQHDRDILALLVRNGQSLCWLPLYLYDWNLGCMGPYQVERGLCGLQAGLNGRRFDSQGADPRASDQSSSES